MKLLNGMIKYVRYKEVSLYRGSFPSILLLLGLGISFVISRTSLYGCSLNRRSTVPVQNCGRFARRRSLGLKSNRSWQTTLYNMVNLLLRDVILVNLGFHMCRTLPSGDFWKYRFAVHNSKSQREDVDFFEKGEKNSRFQTKTNACRWDPTSRHD